MSVTHVTPDWRIVHYMHMYKFNQSKCKHYYCGLSVERIRSWLVLNSLAFNDRKLELLCFNPNPLTGINSDFNLTIGTVICKPQTSVRNLGVHFDSSMSLDHQVSTTTRSCFAILRNLWKIRHWLTVQSAKELVPAHIISRLNYCNSILIGCTTNTIQPLQQVQNCATRFVYGVTGRSPTSCMLRDLHWLPIRHHVL